MGPTRSHVGQLRASVVAVNATPAMVEILCDMDETKLLLEAARSVYPEAVPFIEDAMNVAPEV